MKLRGLVLPLLLTVAAFGGVIDFNTLPGNNGDAFATYTENGFTVTSTAGAWEVGLNFGNPLPSIFCGGCSTGTIEITGGQFTYNSFDLGNPGSSAASYQVTGFLNGSVVLSDVGNGPSTPDTWSTIPSPNTGQLLDSLFISVFTTNIDANVDNINLTSSGVPEPGTAGLLVCSLGALAAIYRRRKA